VIQKAEDEQAASNPTVQCIGEPLDIVHALATRRVDVVAGTPWLFARSDMMEAVDTLVIDEAGQLSLANVIAMCGAARNLILCGDPQQLRQPVLGIHPDGVARSGLEHYLGDERTMPDDRGLFLDVTWRMHPSICAFVSEAFYEGRLTTAPETFGHRIVANSPSLSGAGLRDVPMRHVGNRVASPEEALEVRRLVEQLITAERVCPDGQTRPVTLQDVLIVAPYNAHVRVLRDALPPGARVGTVDRFQGQEAAVVIYSMATSAGRDQPRSIDFLFNLNRFNVAVSRAQVAVFLVHSQELAAVKPRTPPELAQVNAMCRFVELASTVVS